MLLGEGGLRLRIGTRDSEDLVTLSLSVGRLGVTGVCGDSKDEDWARDAV